MSGSKAVLKSPMYIVLLWGVMSLKKSVKNLFETESLWEGAYRQNRTKLVLLLSRLILVSLPGTWEVISVLLVQSSFLIRIASPSLGALLRGLGGRLRAVS